MKKKRSGTKEVYTLADLKNWRELDPPVRLGVFGDPVEHSLSPQMQNAALKHCQIDMQYARFRVLPIELREAFELIRKLKFAGVNLTIPHKIAALDLLDSADDNVKKIGATNVVKVDCSHAPVARRTTRSAAATTLRGFNTDGRGFARAVREEFLVDLRDLRILVLGAGGAARAIALQCAKENCERLVIASRTFDQGQQLVDSLRNFFEGPKVLGPVPRLQAIPWEERAFQFQIANVDLVVNATPVGLNRGDASPIPARLLAPHVMVYDTIYSNKRTPLVSASIEAGARAANGLSMLLHQGALAFEIWFQREAPLEVMRKALAGGSG